MLASHLFFLVSQNHCICAHHLPSRVLFLTSFLEPRVAGPLPLQANLVAANRCFDGMLTAVFHKQCTSERLERLLSNGFFEIPLDFDSDHNHSALAFPGFLPGPTLFVLPHRSAIPFSPSTTCPTT